MPRSRAASKTEKTQDRKNRTGRSPTEIDRIVGANLRKVRLRRDLTLAGLSAEMGISHQQLQKYEIGTNRLSAGMMSIAAEVLNIQIAHLFEEDEQSASGKSRTAEGGLREEAGFWLTRIRSRATLQLAVRILKALAS
ncbi:helix-turn-helix domain-containing protein [Hyphomonas atlantica]|uniref:HTH cro/C1-type domain-containing protein n=1 Tax=Hyphomonas atlantica TaxID=1280948 RepID=A0A059E9R6_9PROT|nr:helix-turn-helix transcriptional regulator [Hyphomonas atlantica]KCZ64679.1 hypothetical protein HY36_12600 [Hyphomonas atlantica]